MSASSSDLSMPLQARQEFEAVAAAATPEEWKEVALGVGQQVCLGEVQPFLTALCCTERQQPPLEDAG